MDKGQPMSQKDDGNKGKGQSMSQKDEGISQYTSVLREMIRHEDVVTNNRLTWMLVSQGVLFAATAAFWKIHLAPLIVIAIMGIGTAVSVFYSLLLSRLARKHLRDLYNKKIGDDENMKKKIPPVAGDAPNAWRAPWLNPGMFIPWWAVFAWVMLLVIRIALDL